jgi:hypothetical protein
LWTQFYFNEGKKIFKWTHYCPIDGASSALLTARSPFWKSATAGGSLQMWKSYFGLRGTVVSIDINPDVKQHEEDQIHIRIGDQSDTAFLQSVVDEFGQFRASSSMTAATSPHQIVS